VFLVSIPPHTEIFGGAWRRSSISPCGKGGARRLLLPRDFSSPVLVGRPRWQTAGRTKCRSGGLRNNWILPEWWV